MLEPEDMGSKSKFWYRGPEHETDWLFKYPQANTGQHWAEKIAAEIAGSLAIPHAKVELATFQDERGSVTESFALDDWKLFHGNQVLAGTVYGYNPKRKFHQSSHTLTNIWQAMDHVFMEPEAARRAKLAIVEYTVLDALRQYGSPPRELGPASEACW